MAGLALTTTSTVAETQRAAGACETAAMQLVELGTARSHAITEFGSSGVELCPIARTADTQVVSAAIASIAPGGQIGRHPTRAWQVFYVIDGSGWVSDARSERVPISAGMAASWGPGEQHAAGSDRGLIACIVETSVDPLAALR